MNKKLLLGAILLVIQDFVVVAQQGNEDLGPDVDVFIEGGQINISINFNEPFRWKNTRFDSIKTFPMRSGAELPHTIRFDGSNNLNWRQTDMVFSGTYLIKESSAKELLAQYNEKHGGFGISTWAVNKEGNLKSFDESNGIYEILAPKEFAERYELNFYFDELSIEASVSGYLLEIIGKFDEQTNLMNFDTLDYMPFFSVPNLIVEESISLRDWTRAELANELPSEYQWPQGLSLNLGNVSNSGKFYRVKILNN